MLLSSAKSLGSSEPMSSRVDIIEISDDEDESKASCKTLANGTHQRQDELIEGNDFVKVSRIVNGHQRTRLKTSVTMPVAYSPGRDGGDNLHPDPAPMVVGRIADENNPLSSCHPKRRTDQSLQNGSVPHTVTKSENRSESTVDFTSCRSSRSLSEMTLCIDDAEADKASLCADAANSHSSIEGDSACKTDLNVSLGVESTGGNSRSPTKFLKPPSPKVALSKKAFFSMLLEDVDDLITKYGSHLIKDITVKDIAGKGLDEMRLPKNLKVTPQLQKKRQFMKPISADDEVIVISDDETPVDSACPETLTDSISESARHVSWQSSERIDLRGSPAKTFIRPDLAVWNDDATLFQTIKNEYQAKQNFLANLQLFHRIKLRKPMKKDITNILKTRNNMKAYIANPHISLVKANCIYKYVTNKGILSPEQFRAQREPPRRKRKAARRTPKPRRSPLKNNRPPAPKRRNPAPPALEFRRSLRKRAVRIANQPQRFSRRFFTSALKEEIGRHERNHVWTAYSPLEVTQHLHVPVIVLNRLESSSPRVSGSVSEGPIIEAARPKEYKCKWCPFHSLNTPSLREHCFEFHGRIFPLVIG